MVLLTTEIAKLSLIFLLCMTRQDRNLIIDAITRMLSRREHAYTEVLRKLAQKGFVENQCIPILNEFKSSDVQSDARFAQMKVRAGAAKGQGPERIKQDCQQWNLDTNHINNAMHESDVDWFELAKRVRIKRFGELLPCDITLRAKQMRFLQYRGFEYEQIHYALESDCDL